MVQKISIIFLLASLPIAVYGNSTPFVKICTTTGASFNFSSYSLHISSKGLENEKSLMRESLRKIGVRESTNGIAIDLLLSDIDLPIQREKYREQIYEQGYRLHISADSIKIVSPSPAGIYYGIITFLQNCTADSLYEVDIKDWPDFPVRMIMVDPARQHEMKSYYKRLIEFCGLYKINCIHFHLTDSQTSCLFHEEYPELMHPYAWKRNDIFELNVFAAKHHITLQPEIESFGHARMFTRLKDAEEYLHQTEMNQSDSPWIIIDIPGYTNMLCPASDKAVKYLEEMYQTASHFNSDCIHIGFDEVDLSKCARCYEKFGHITGPQLFGRHLNNCIEISGRHFKKIGLWGDMILKHPEILETIPSDKVIIYDWYYFPDVASHSVNLFQNQGFEVIACPALVCWPHILFPDHNNYTNISRFTKIAYDNELLGVNTTIWAPMRYMSDILWTGIAFAAVHSWAGSIWNETEFYREFVREFFGSPQGEAFKKVWNELCAISIHLDTFYTGSWSDHESLDQAKVLATERAEEYNSIVNRLQLVQKELSVIGTSITRHSIEWDAIEQTTAMRCYILQHLLASNKIETDQGWNSALIQKLDDSCVLALKWIENNWDRNRYADDPNKNGIYVPTDHILHRFKLMHEFHQYLLVTIK